MNDRPPRSILVHSNHIYVRKELPHLILWKKKTVRRNVALCRVDIHWFLSKMPFSLIKAMELQHFVFIRKDLTPMYICYVIFFKINIYILKVIYK